MEIEIQYVVSKGAAQKIKNLVRNERNGTPNLKIVPEWSGIFLFRFVPCPSVMCPFKDECLAYHSVPRKISRYRRVFPEIIQKSCSCPEASRLASILLRSRLVPLLKVSLLYPRLKMCFAIYTFTRAYDSINLINSNFLTGV